MKYYIQHNKLGTKPVLLNTINEVAQRLGDLCKSTSGMSRSAFMQNRVDLGHPSDESSGRTFIEAMSETVNIGLVKDGQLLRCNICDANHYSKYKVEMGD
jgi:hypothetical protein